MIKKIKRNFILLSMLPLLLVIIAIVLTMNAINYASFIKDADSATDWLAYEDAIFSSQHTAWHDQNIKPPQNPPSKMTKDARYFKVYEDSDGNVSCVLIKGLSSVTEAEAMQLAESVSDKDAVGFVDSYRYRVAERKTYKTVVFLDCTHRIDTIKSFAATSILVSAIGYLIVLLAVLVLADRIIRPFKETYEKQKQFITDAGHEIKTPLTIISANLDLCDIEYGENEYTGEIRTQIDNMRELTSSLVFLAKMDESDSLPMIELPISDIVEETVFSFHAPSKLKGKKITANITPMISINGNDRAIRGLVSVLMDNALKYSPEDTEITVSLIKHGRAAELSVKNKTVQALSKEQLNKLFERFWRTDGSRNSETGGHGIGLSVARAVAEKHGGKITAQADSDELTITVTLPSI